MTWYLSLPLSGFIWNWWLIILPLKKKYHETLHKGLQLDSLNRSLLEIKARYAFKIKNYQETVNTLDLVFTHHADTLHYYAGLAGICQMHLDNLEKAEQWFQYIIDKGDDTELTHYYMGLTYDKMEAHSKAADHFRKAIEKGISENMFNYYVSLAESYEKTNHLDASIRAYQEAYKYNRQDILLYKLARNYDTYYEDKRTAIRYYQKFLDQSNANTDNPYATYANQRINELSEYLHVIDTVN
jgi:tetratricopeptide (TPR) repeat protein